jgi:Cu-Zn family superoxide dismutase
MSARPVNIAAIATLALLLSGCDSLSKGPFAVANVQGGEGSRIWGRVTFHQAEGGTYVGQSIGYSAPVASAAAHSAAGKTYIHADINGLPSNRQFGFHVHEKGDCSDGGMGAGGHFNPQGKSHGRYDSTERHMGDLPNLSSNGEGVAVYSFTTDQLTVAPGPHSVVNRAIVIHESADDYKSQPAGNSGKRIACGVIRSAD